MHAIRPSDNAKHPRRWITFAGAVVALLLGVAGARAASPAEHLNPQIIVSHHHWYQLGVASWYGKYFEGRTTASGQPFDPSQMTCAHRTLPLGSVLRVTNLENHKSVIVTVNDRGPVPENRVIDLSRAAADALGFSDRGLAPVKVELIGPQDELAQLLMPAGLEPPRE
ncbi:MAG TPA: septal ring lytic transglycosylase RlpA family protein [Acidobacteriaceae bacterium]|nr:septal ring lytic transglycosylase RlpA family protein [Acidobacteriaceae bacterium]